MKRTLVPLLIGVSVLGAGVGTASAATPAAKGGTVHPMDNYGCPYGAICVWKGPNRSGGMYEPFFSCVPHNIGHFGPISYDNNQTHGTVARFKTKNGWNMNSKPAWGYDGSFGNSKTYFYQVDPC